MSREKQTKTKVGILSLSLLSMLTVGLNTGLSAIQQAFPEAGTLLIQISANTMSITVIVVSLFVNRIYERFTRKRTVLLGEGILVLTALTAFFYHSSIYCVMFYSALTGVSAALILPAVGSAIIDCFETPYRAKLSGWQSILSSIGGIWFSLLGGFLAGIRWYALYLVFLLAVPVAVFTVYMYPENQHEGNRKKTGNAKKKSGHRVMIKYGLAAIAYVITFGVFMSNISMFVAEEKLGTQAQAGWIGALSMLGGMLGGMAFRRLYTRLGRKIFVLTFAGAAAGQMLLFFTGGLLGCAAAGLLIGMCQSIHMPSCLLALGEEAGAEQSVSAALIVSCIAANVGTLLSPVLFTGGANLFFGGNIRPRFLMAGVFALGMAVCMSAACRKSTRHVPAANESMG